MSKVEERESTSHGERVLVLTFISDARDAESRSACSCCIRRCCCSRCRRRVSASITHADNRE